MFEAHEIKEFVNQFADVLTKDELQKMTESIKPNGAFGDVERILSEAIERLQEKHLKVIFDRKWDYMFQDGLPHFGWNTDRRLFIRVLTDRSMKLDTYVSHETWYDIHTSFYEYHGIFFKTRVEACKSFTGGTDHYSLQFLDEAEIPEPRTTCVVVTKFVEGEMKIWDQFTGSQKECDKKIDEYVGKYGTDAYIRVFDIKDKVNK